MRIRLKDIVLDWFWDGAPVAKAVLSDYFGTSGHLCLQHAKGCFKGHFSGAMKHEIQNVVEMSAFCPPLVFHVAMERLIEKLKLEGPLQEKCLKYMTTANAGHSLQIQNGIWSAPWCSSFRHCQPGFSTFLNQCVESGWRVEDLMFGKTDRDFTHNIIDKIRRRIQHWSHHSFFASVHHRPCGPNRFQPNLVFGDGITSPVNGLYSSSWVRFTAEKLSVLYNHDNTLVKQMGARGPYVETWVVPKRPKTVISQHLMEQFTLLFFSGDLATTLRHFPKHEGQNSLGGLKQLMMDYTIIGRKLDGSMHDLHRDGMIHNVTEHLNFVNHTFFNIDLGPLHGTPSSSQPKRLTRQREERLATRARLLDLPTTPAPTSAEPAGIPAPQPASPTDDDPAAIPDAPPSPLVALSLQAPVASALPQPVFGNSEPALQFEFLTCTNPRCRPNTWQVPASKREMGSKFKRKFTCAIAGETCTPRDTTLKRRSRGS